MFYMMWNRFTKILLGLLFICCVAYAKDNLADFSDSSLPILNNELRQLNENIDKKIKDQGDSTSVDFAVGDLTTDGTWNDLDLSSLIPKDARWVILQVEVKDDAAGSVMQFRKNGNYNAINISQIATQVANVSTYADLMVQVDTKGKIEYKGSNLAFTTINITIKGYMK